MKSTIKFLASIADGKLNPAFGFVRIENNRAYAGNQVAMVMVECESTVDITVNASRALAAANAIKGELSIKVNEKSATISGGGVKVIAPTIPNDQFPKIEPEGSKISISGKILDSLRVAKQFSAENDTRPIFNGVYVGENIRATDGKHGVRLNGIDGISAILPVKAVDLLLKIGEEPISASCATTSVTFHYQWGWARCHVIDGKYPCEQMDNGMATNAEFKDIGALKDAVSTCKSVIGNNGDIIINNHSVKGDDAVTVDIDTGIDDARFNCGLFSKCIDVADALAISDGERSPAVFKGDNGLVGFVMPVVR